MLLVRVWVWVWWVVHEHACVHGSLVRLGQVPAKWVLVDTVR